MNIAFFGSPEIAKDILESINRKFPVSLVVTQPDKPVGRKKIITPTPVAQWAMDHSIPLKKPASLDKFILTSVDLAIVVAYGKIIPQSVLTKPKYRFINVHYSLLPQYRGAAPVQFAILNGDPETGVTIMKMDEELDHGEIISQKTVTIDSNDTTKSLLKKLTDTAKPLLIDVIQYVQEHNSLPTLTAQDHSKATYCKRITKQNGFIEFQDVRKALQEQGTRAHQLHNKIRAYFPWPVAWTILPNGKRCKLLSSHIKLNVFGIDEIQIEGKASVQDANSIRSHFK